LSITILPGLTIDASTGSAWLLGFVKGLQYEGLARDAAGVLPNDDVQLTNCFASTYAMLESFDTAAYNIRTFTSEVGTIKIFDAAFLDPIHILGDMTVEWE